MFDFFHFTGIVNDKENFDQFHCSELVDFFRSESLLSEV